MSNTPHIVIIGAGLIGLSTADSLMKRGARVTLIESRTGPGQGASFCNSGMIHASQAMPWMIESGSSQEAVIAGKHVYSLACLSTDLLEARMQFLRVPIGDSPGCIQIFETGSAGRKAEQTYKALGVPFERRDDFRWAFGKHGLYFPGDGAGNAHIYCSVLARNLSERGANLIYGADPVELSLSGGRAALTGGNESDKPDHIIVAAGAGSAALMLPLGLCLPVRGLRGHALNFNRPNIDLPNVPIMHYPSRSALTVFDDHVRLSGTVNEDNPRVLLDIWRKIAPEIILKLGDPISEWSGERPVSGLGKPIIGQTPLQNLWVNCGHGHMGWTLCAGSGEIMADMILDGMAYPRFGWPD